jgi:hypothetical protein
MSGSIRLATSGDGAVLAAIYAPALSNQATSFELEVPTRSRRTWRQARQTRHPRGLFRPSRARDSPRRWRPACRACALRRKIPSPSAGG